MAEEKNFGATQEVLQYLRKNSDVVVPYKELESALDLPDYTVANSVGYLIRTAGISNMERPSRGMVIYHSGKQTEKPAKASPEMYEHIANISPKEILIRGENAQIYVALPVEQYYRK
jgi:hypothetical protein